jgi:hypothetical protein
MDRHDTLFDPFVSHVFNSRCGGLHAISLLCSVAKLPNLELKTQPRQLLRILPVTKIVNYGATPFSKMTVSITTLRKTTFSIKSIKCDTKHNNNQHSKNQHYGSVVIHSVIMLNLVMLNVIMQNVIMLNLVMLNAIMLNVLMLNVDMKNVINNAFIRSD